MRIALLAFLLLPSPQDSADPYFKFKKGTCWVFDSTEGGEKETITFTVYKEEGGKVLTSMERGDREAEACTWEVKDGLLLFSFEGGEVALPMYKVGSKKGDTWKTDAFEATHEGLEEVKVPAGTYKDVLHVSIKMDSDRVVHVYLAPKVGLIKLETPGDFLAELREVKEVKDVKEPVPAAILRNERNAAHSLKTLAIAESDFRSNDRDDNRVNDFWTGDVSFLFRVKDQKLIDKEVAEADAAPAAFEFMTKPWIEKPKPKDGYYYRAIPKDEKGNDLAQDTDKSGAKCRNLSRFAFCAYPAEYGKTGEKTYILSEEYTIYAGDTGGKPVENWPTEEELKKSWKAVD